MKTIRNLFLISNLELQRAFTTRRGITVMVAFALIWSLILIYVVARAGAWLSGEGKMLRLPINSELVNSLLNWQVAEFSVFWVIALYLSPLFCLLMAADQTASDRARGTLRLLSLHTTRGTIFFGRFAGWMIVQALFLAVLVTATFAIATLRDQTLVVPAMDAAAMVFVNLLFLIAAFTAAMALISLFTTSARQAIVWAVILWILATLLIWILTKYVPAASNLSWLLPGAQIKSLLYYNNWQSMQLAIIPLAQAAALLITGYVVMKRRDL